MFILPERPFCLSHCQGVWLLWSSNWIMHDSLIEALRLQEDGSLLIWIQRHTFLFWGWLFLRNLIIKVQRWIRKVVNCVHVCRVEVCRLCDVKHKIITLNGPVAFVTLLQWSSKSLVKSSWSFFLFFFFFYAFCCNYTFPMCSLLFPDSCIFSIPQSRHSWRYWCNPVSNQICLFWMMPPHPRWSSESSSESGGLTKPYSNWFIVR